MLNRVVAIERLRTCGRLSAAPRPQHVITAEQLDARVACDVKRLLDQHARLTGPRCLAPSVNHAVLP
jgi:hypothetical protein